MLALVRIALKRPYTFVVMAMLIVIFGVISWICTPTDIFPAIRIPVVAVVWTYNGLPPDDMSGRVVYFYERSISATVNDIEHIESQSMAGYGVVKIFFQPTVDINAALAQITAASQTVLKLLPPGITPPYVLTFNASSVPVIQLALSSDTLSEAKDLRLRAEHDPSAACHGRRRRRALALWRQGAAGADRRRSGETAAPTIFRRRMSSRRVGSRI